MGAVPRAGIRALSIFTHALNARVLRAHAGGSLRSSELEEMLGWAPQSSLRLAVGNMIEVGVLGKIKSQDGTSSAETDLTAAGRELLPVADALEEWLATAPSGPIALEEDAAHGTVRVLSAAWDSDMVRGLAEGPVTLAELSASIASTNYPALKRRLAKLRSTGLVLPIGEDRVSAYVASDWLRRAILPLAVAARWERKHDPGAEQVSQVVVEAAFLLVLSLVELSARSSGTCALAVLIPDSDEEARRNAAGVLLEVEKGRIVSCQAGTAAKPPTWVLGTSEAWFDAVIDGARNGLRVGGAKPRLAQGLVRALHEALAS